MVQVLEASVLGALLYLGLGELGQQNYLSQVVRRQRMEHEGCRGQVYPMPHPPRTHSVLPGLPPGHLSLPIVI